MTEEETKLDYVIAAKKALTRRNAAQDAWYRDKTIQMCLETGEHYYKPKNEDLELGFLVECERLRQAVEFVAKELTKRDRDPRNYSRQSGGVSTDWQCSTKSPKRSSTQSNTTTKQ